MNQSTVSRRHHFVSFVRRREFVKQLAQGVYENDHGLKRCLQLVIHRCCVPLRLLVTQKLLLCLHTLQFVSLLFCFVIHYKHYSGLAEVGLLLHLDRDKLRFELVRLQHFHWGGLVLR